MVKSTLLSLQLGLEDYTMYVHSGMLFAIIHLILKLHLKPQPQPKPTSQTPTST
jgi:hypothetical protein